MTLVLTVCEMKVKTVSLKSQTLMDFRLTVRRTESFKQVLSQVSAQILSFVSYLIIKQIDNLRADFLITKFIKLLS